MFEEMQSFLNGFDITSVCFGFALFCFGNVIEAFFDLIKWLIKFIFNRNSPPSGEDK